MIDSGAEFSPCGRFRLRLWRRWGPGRRLVFVMLNPSTADAVRADPTVRKCIGFARRHLYEAIEIVNLFDYCATLPADLKKALYPLSPGADVAIASAVFKADVCCAWGVHARAVPIRLRADYVLKLVRKCGGRPMALDLSRDGIPLHPLMLSYSCIMQPL